MGDQRLTGGGAFKFNSRRTYDWGWNPSVSKFILLSPLHGHIGRHDKPRGGRYCDGRVLVANTMRETFQRDEARAAKASVGTVVTNRPPEFGDGERGQPTTRLASVARSGFVPRGDVEPELPPHLWQPEPEKSKGKCARGDSEAGVSRAGQNLTEATLAVCASPRMGFYS